MTIWLEQTVGPCCSRSRQKKPLCVFPRKRAKNPGFHTSFGARHSLQTWQVSDSDAFVVRESLWGPMGLRAAALRAAQHVLWFLKYWCSLFYSRDSRGVDHGFEMPATKDSRWSWLTAAKLPAARRSLRNLRQPSHHIFEVGSWPASRYTIFCCTTMNSYLYRSTFYIVMDLCPQALTLTCHSHVLKFL